MVRMAGNVCAYENCFNSPRKYPGLVMFRFPTDINLAKKWVENCGNIDLINLPMNKLRNKRICQHHFASDVFFPGQSRIFRTAVPIPFVVDDSATPEKRYKKKYTVRKKNTKEPQREHCTDSNEYLQNPLIENSTLSEPKSKTIHNGPPSAKKHNNLITELRKTNNDQKKKIYYLQKKVLHLKNYIRRSCIRLPKETSSLNKTLISMQTKTGPRIRWTKCEIQFALSIFYKSPSVYKFLRQFGVVLPNVDSLRRWIKISNCLRGRVNSQEHGKENQNVVIVKEETMEIKEEILEEAKENTNDDVQKEEQKINQQTETADTDERNLDVLQQQQQSLERLISANEEADRPPPVGDEIKEEDIDLKEEDRNDCDITMNQWDLNFS